MPAENLLGGEGYGFLIAMKTFDRTRTGVASAAVGNAQAAYDYSREWAKNRIQFGHPGDGPAGRFIHAGRNGH